MDLVLTLITVEQGDRAVQFLNVTVLRVSPQALSREEQFRTELALGFPALMKIRHVVLQHLNLPGLEVAVEAVLGPVTSEAMLSHRALLGSAVIADLTVDTLSLLLNKEVFLLLLCLPSRLYVCTVTSPLMSLHRLTVGAYKAAEILPTAEALQPGLL